MSRALGRFVFSLVCSHAKCSAHCSYNDLKKRINVKARGKSKRQFDEKAQYIGIMQTKMETTIWVLRCRVSPSY